MDSKIYKKFVAINSIFNLCVALPMPILSAYLVYRGFIDWQISLMFTVFPLVNIIFLPFLGKIADTVGKRFVIWLGIWVEIIALLLYIIDGHWGLVVTARLLDAVSVAFVVLIMLAKIEDAISQRRGKNTGKSLSIIYAGHLVGSFLGPVLADYFFIQFPFIVAIIILIILSCFLFDKNFKNISLTQNISSISWLKQIKIFLSHPQLRGMGIMGMVMHAVQPTFDVFLPLIVIEKFGLTYKAIGLAMLCFGITHFLQIFFGKLADKYGAWKLVIFGTTLYAIMCFFIFYINNFALFLFALFILGIGSSIWNVSAWSLMSEIGEREKIEAQVVTEYFSIAKIGSLFSFLVSAYIVNMWGLESVFLMNGIVIFIGIIFAFKHLKSQNCNA